MIQKALLESVLDAALMGGGDLSEIFFEDTRRLVRNYPNLRIDMNDVLKNELIKLLSDKKVTYFAE